MAADRAPRSRRQASRPRRPFFDSGPSRALLGRAAAFLGALVLSLAAPTASHAFGKNKVITRHFRWHVISTRHFDIYFTPEAEAMLPRVAYHLEKAYDRVTRDLGIDIKERTPFFFFPSHNQFEENNIVDVGEGTGGVTEAFKNRFLIFHNGRDQWLEHVITHEFAHVAEFEILYGGFWRSARILKSPLYPLWLMEGYAEYVTGDLDRAEEDLYLRDAATANGLFPLGEIHGFNHLKPHQITLAYKEGAAAVRFLAQEYGRENVGEVLKAMRDRFEPFSMIQDITGQDFRTFDRRFREYLTDFYRIQSDGLQEPETSGERLTQRDVLPVFNTNPAVSPDGRRMAYLTDRSGAREIVLYDLDTKTEAAVAGREWGRLENIHGARPEDGRAISYSPDGRWVAFAGEKLQRDFLYLYDTKRRRLRRVRTPFEQIRSPAFHPAQPRLAIVGMKDGMNDLYEITLRGKVIRRLTRTPENENMPVYSPDGAVLAFSQEVVPSTEAVAARDAGPAPLRGPFAETNLVGLNLTSLSTAALTDLPGDETYPVFSPDGGSVVFVAEPDRIHNLYRLDLAGGNLTRLTEVVGGNFGPDISREDGALVFSSFRRGSQQIYRAPPDLWQRAASTGPVVSKNPAARNWAALTGAREPAAVAAPGAPDRTEAVQTLARPPFLSGARSEDDLFVSSRHPYRFRASTDLFFPLFYYSSTDGLFVAALWQASEYLGNHRLQTAVQYSSGERFLDYEVQYAYSRFRPQFVLGAGGKNFYRDFARTELRRETDVFAGVIYPLDRFSRLETVAMSVFRGDEFLKISELDVEERENAVSLSYLRDTTTGRYLAVTGGNRFRATVAEARPVLGGDRDYNSQVFEYHRFTPTGRESTVAFRGLAGVSVGPSPQLFRLGGMDRLRGYSRNENAHKATRYVLSNLEWRVPLTYLRSYTWFLFPDVSFKAVYGTLFTDAGYDWSRSRDLEDLRATRIRNSVGAGIRIPSFILQTFPVTFSVEAAKRTDADHWVVYFGLGPRF